MDLVQSQVTILPSLRQLHFVPLSFLIRRHVPFHPLECPGLNEESYGPLCLRDTPSPFVHTFSIPRGLTLRQKKPTMKKRLKHSKCMAILSHLVGGKLFSLITPRHKNQSNTFKMMLSQESFFLFLFF